MIGARSFAVAPMSFLPASQPPGTPHNDDHEGIPQPDAAYQTPVPPPWPS